MNATIYRYKIIGANWGDSVMTEALLEKIAVLLMEHPFYGDEAETQFGFTQCDYKDGKIFGLFIQKYSAILIDYDPVTKAEIKKSTIDCGEYLFVLNLTEYEIFFQTRKSSDLPSNEEINRRFVGQLKLVLHSINYGFEYIEVTQDKTDRDKIVSIFYEISDRVLELEFDEFDINLIEEEKKKRGGKRQVYFNPKEEYQEALEESAIRLAKHTDKASIKAKQGENLKNDPITRAMLEVSRKPIKIVYTCENEQYTEFGVTKRKEVIAVEGDSFNLIDQIENIFSNIFGKKRNDNDKKKRNDGQGNLF